ncbi:MAG TPA: hypothetical protein VFW11_17675 [Cyclobacteriaceae bacterium]|nr:hypothetical protein [Cyclobacteriaceae bacterium]
MNIDHKSNDLVKYLSVPLILLLITTSSVGVFVSNFYSHETVNWQTQSVAQDAIDLFVVCPVLIVTSLLAFRNKRMASLILSGTLLYVIYTFVIFCFNVHFNSLFLFYCFILGLSFYLFIYLIYSESKNPTVGNGLKTEAMTRAIAIYFISVAGIFYLLWLTEIIPAFLNKKVPKTIVEAGLFTNPVHVLDLAIILPGIFVSGILLLKKNIIGFLMTPIVLTFLILMDMSIAFLSFMMMKKELDGSVVVSSVMILLGLLSLLLLIGYSRSIEEKSIKTINEAEPRLMI